VVRSTSAKSVGEFVLMEELTRDEFATLVKRKPLAIVPVGSVEEHGSHLPLCTDSYQAEEIACRIARKFNAIVCPPIRYGECRTTRNFSGTISLSFETVQGIAFDIVSELGRNGLDKVLVLTGHAGSGHMAALRLGVQRAVEKNPRLKVMVLSDYDIAYERLGKEFSKKDGHGGDLETSRILGIRPELVGKSRPKGSSRPPDFMVLPDPEKYFPEGIYGNTSRASAKKGKRADDYIVRRLCEIISRNFGIKRV